jgi:hypothetical protein
MSEPKKPEKFSSVIEMLTWDCHEYAVENARLKAKVEQLTKAGDAMFFIMEKRPVKRGSNYAMLSWLAAKKGWSSK